MIRRKKAAGGQVRLTFCLPGDEPPGEVSVVGSFNEWTPGRHRMVRRAGGTRSVSVLVPAGARVRFRYLGERGHWFDDPEADWTDPDGCEIVA